MLIFILLMFVIVSISYMIFFVYRPLGSKYFTSSESNVALGKVKLKELTDDIKEGTLSEKSLTVAELDIKTTLAYELEKKHKTLSDKHSFNPLLIILFVAIFTSVTASTLYVKLGVFDIEKKLDTLDAITNISQLESYVERYPDDLFALKKLAHVYFANNNLARSEEIYKRAYDLSKRQNKADVELIIEYASVVAARKNNNLAGVPARLIKEALAFDSNHVSTLYLAGLAAYQQGEFALAKIAWQKARAQMEVGSADYETLNAQISLLDKEFSPVKTQEQMQNKESKDLKKEVHARKIIVRPDISDAVKKKFHTDDFVLIYAKAAHGRPVPIAIRKFRLKTLPEMVVLSDKDAMLEGVNLKSTSSVIVVLRLSKTGMAMKQADDVETQSAIINLSKNPTPTLILILK